MTENMDKKIAELKNQHKMEVQIFMQEHTFPCENQRDVKKVIAAIGYSTYKYLSRFLKWNEGIYMKTEYLDHLNDLLNRQRDEMKALCGDPYFKHKLYTGKDYNPWV